MVMEQSLETLIARADPILTVAWTAFIREQDARYARMAREQGKSYSTFDDDEVREVARIAAALGVSPADSRAFESGQSGDAVRERVPVLAG